MAITTIRPQDLGKNAGRPDQTGQALQNLAESFAHNLMQKRHDKQQQQDKESSYSQLIDGGFPPEIADIILSQRPEDRIKAFELFGAGRQENPGNGQKAFQKMAQPNQQIGIQELLGGQQGQQGQQQNAIMKNLMKILQPQQQQEQMQPQFMQQPPESQQIQGENTLTAYDALAKYERPQDKQARLKRDQQERQFQQKEKREERKLSHVQQKEIDKETLPVYKKINEDAKAAKSNNLRLDRMANLVNEGKLVGSKFASFLQGLEKIPVIGGAASSILKAYTYSPESLEFEKLTFDFLKDAKSVFGSRLTNYDVESFLKTVPTLSLSPGGKKRVIQNLHLLNDAAEVRQKALKEVIKESGGNRPRDLELKIEERASKELDSIAEKFKKGYASLIV